MVLNVQGLLEQFRVRGVECLNDMVEVEVEVEVEWSNKLETKRGTIIGYEDIGTALS
jgi:hypothetical protein